MTARKVSATCWGLMETASLGLLGADKFCAAPVRNSSAVSKPMPMVTDTRLRFMGGETGGFSGSEERLQAPSVKSERLQRHAPVASGVEPHITRRTVHATS